MDEREFWQMFTQTGEPIAYVLYRGAQDEAHRRAEQENRQEGATCNTQQSKAL